MKEQTLKTWIFILLLTGKLFIILYLYIKTSVGGLLANEEATMAGSIILPLFVAYLSVVLEDFFSNPYRKSKEKNTSANSPKVKNSIVIATFLVIPFYVLGFWLIIKLSAQGSIATENLPKLLAGIESVLGVYVGIIVKSLFKSKSTSNE